MRLDIAWSDVLRALIYAMLPRWRSRANREAERAWGSESDFLITLSVRSAFDLALRALKLPRGSEILLSALTVPDMVRIVQSHGLVPVPVDIDTRGHLCLHSLRNNLSERSRMLVVAHLFGSRAPLDDAVEILRPYKIYLVEDCAQGFERVGDRGHASSDIVMHSFGPIKTSTALGGAVVRIASPELRTRMATTLECDPIQSRASYARHVARFAVLKALSGNRTFELFWRCAHRLGRDVDSLLNSFGHGFNPADIIAQIRRRPSAPLLRLLRRRWQTYDVGRIERRRHLGRLLDERICEQHPPEHSYWVYPLFVADPQGVCDRLRTAGFDATRQSRMIIVPGVDDSRVPTAATCWWDQVVFLPWYPDMTDEAVEQMATHLQSCRPRIPASDGRTATPRTGQPA